MTSSKTVRANPVRRFTNELTAAFFALAVTASALVEPPALNAANAQGEVQVRPVHIVVLVDESGSIDQEQMDREKDATLLIALGEFAVGSTVSVVGFASDDDAEGNQSPVDQVCSPTVVKSAPDREALSTCVQKLRRREDGQGDGTDHAIAMRQALTNLQSAPADEPKVVFLLTDGKLDVSNSPVYGKNNEGDRRNIAAREELRNQLARANEANVQVWPMGFGTNIDTGQLDEFANSASQRTCGENSPKPRAKVVADSNDVISSMLDAFSSSRCAGKGVLVSTTTKPGSTVEATVDIPSIATDGSIVVFRQDPKIAISYEDPMGRVVPKSDNLDDTKFEVAGENGPVESLHVVNPIPGKWKIKLTTPPDSPERSVTSTVVWQGAARAVLNVDPPSPVAGEPVKIGVRLETRKNAVIDPTMLAGLSFTGRITGTGFDAIPVSLADDGGGPDVKANDGLFTGQGTIPAGAAGALKFTGAVSGVGIQSDERSQDGVVAPGQAQIRAQVRITDTEPFVPPGGAKAATVNITNNTGKSQRIRLVLKDLSPGVVVSASPAVFDLPDSGESRFDFSLQFADNTVVGANSGTIQVVDDADPSKVWHTTSFAVAVSYPPTLLERLLWLWITLAVLVAATVVFILVRLTGRKRTRDVRGVSVQLIKGGRSTYLQAPDRAASVFRFTVREDSGTAVPNHVNDASEPAYSLRRNNSGGVELHHLDGSVSELKPDSPVPISSDVQVTYQDQGGRLAAQPTKRPTKRPAGPEVEPRASTSPGVHVPRSRRHAADRTDEPDDLL